MPNDFIAAPSKDIRAHIRKHKCGTNRLNNVLHKQKNYTLLSDGLVKNAGLVMPDLIRHPEHIENTGFRPLPE